MKLLNKNARGSVLIIFVLLMPVLILTAAYFLQLSTSNFSSARLDQLQTEAQLAADAGADYSIEQLATNSSYTGTGTAITLHNDGLIKTTYITTITGNSNSKTIAVTGYAYFPASSTTPKTHVNVDVDLYPVVTGNFSLDAGAGGVVMSNSSKIVGGNVLINGNISMSNTSQIGLSTNPVTVDVGDQICPTSSPYTNYPQVCAAGGPQPISISNSAHIYGTVTATNQTSGAGMSNPGLVAGSVTPQPLPSYNRSAQESAVTSTMTGTNASCKKNTMTWAANLKITGDVSISGTCKLTILGNVWITGSFSMANTSSMTVDNSVGTTRPFIIVDGSSGVNFSNSGSIIANSSGMGVEFITYYCGAGCSVESTPTGATLHSSQTINTISLSNSLSASNSIFYAYWSEVSLGNTGAIGAVIGQTINLSNTATITFGSSTGVGITTWVVKGYRTP